MHYAMEYVSLFFFRFYFFLELYSIHELLWALAHQAVAFAIMLITGVSLVVVVKLLDLVMTWYSCPEIIFALYFLPIFLAGIATHSFIAEHYYQKVGGMYVHFDNRYVFSVVLVNSS